MKNSPRTHYFYQVDNRNQPVGGALILRQKRPKVGRWVELITSPCCPVFELVATPSGTVGTSFTLTVKCGVTNIATVLVSQAVATVTLADLVGLLNHDAGFIGSFSVDGTAIRLVLNTELALNCATVSTLSFTVA